MAYEWQNQTEHAENNNNNNNNNNETINESLPVTSKAVPADMMGVDFEAIIWIGLGSLGKYM